MGHRTTSGTARHTTERTKSPTGGNGTLRTLAGGEGTATAINDAGVVVGSQGPLYEGRPVRWPSVTAGPRDDGLVAAGYSAGGDTDNQPLVWRCR
jgi:hypothetical protein